MEIVAYEDARAYSRSQHLFPDEMHYRDVDPVDKWTKLFLGVTAICICIYTAARSVVLTRDGARDANALGSPRRCAKYLLCA